MSRQSLSVLIAFARLHAIAAAQGQTIFPATPTNLEMIVSPCSIAVGDLDHDGNPDLVTANSPGDSVSVLMGIGGGNFGAPSSKPVGSAPDFVILAELNGDGNLDVITARLGAGRVDVLLGSGTQGLLTQVSFDAGGAPRTVAAGDLNSDGHPDIVTANSWSNSVSVLMGVGDGTLTQPVQVKLAPGNTDVATAAVLGDVNADGLLDVAATSVYWASLPPGMLPGNLVIAFGTGDGGFLPTTSVHALGLKYPTALTLGDLHGDGVLDVVTLEAPNTVSVFVGTGGGSLTTPTSYGVGMNPKAIALGDVNGDSFLDIVTGDQGTGVLGTGLSLFLGTGDGGFAAIQQLVAGSEPLSVSTCDVNVDGRIDLVTANHSSHSVSLLVNSLAGPLGTAAFGTGTPGCAGQLGLDGNSIPSIGNSGFAILGSNAPPDSLGLLLMTDADDPMGSDVFGIQVLMHVKFDGATEIHGINTISGPRGEQFAPVPIPFSLGLIGRYFYFQTAWIEPIDRRCTPGMIGLESSRGLAVTIQP